MRDEFFRKVPSMRDDFNHFYPSLRDFYAYYGEICMGCSSENTANYSLNLPICVCASRKFDKKMGKYAKIMKKNTKSM